ncbi:hypothetical protein ACFHW2_02820 [Actinomadura sp. LOL_016]
MEAAVVGRTGTPGRRVAAGARERGHGVRTLNRTSAARRAEERR